MVMRLMKKCLQVQCRPIARIETNGKAVSHVMGNKKLTIPKHFKTAI